MTTISSHNCSNHLRAHGLRQARFVFLLTFGSVVNQLSSEDLLRGETAKGRQHSVTTTFDSETTENPDEATVRKLVILK